MNKSRKTAKPVAPSQSSYDEVKLKYMTADRNYETIKKLARKGESSFSDVTQVSLGRRGHVTTCWVFDALVTERRGDRGRYVQVETLRASKF